MFKLKLKFFRAVSTCRFLPGYWRNLAVIKYANMDASFHGAKDANDALRRGVARFLSRLPYRTYYKGLEQPSKLPYRSIPARKTVPAVLYPGPEGCLTPEEVQDFLDKRRDKGLEQP